MRNSSEASITVEFIFQPSLSVFTALPLVHRHGMNLYPNSFGERALLSVSVSVDIRTIHIMKLIVLNAHIHRTLISVSGIARRKRTPHTRAVMYCAFSQESEGFFLLLFQLGTVLPLFLSTAAEFSGFNFARRALRLRRSLLMSYSIRDRDLERDHERALDVPWLVTGAPCNAISSDRLSIDS